MSETSDYPGALKPLRKCFVICPIGEANTDTRAWSDDIFANLIEPIALEAGFEAKRALEGSRPGEITDHIIADIINADLVVADLTFHNANVFYELAIRHAQGTPYIHVAKAGTRIPFDIAATNVVMIHSDSYGGSDATRRELKAHFKAVVEKTVTFDNPLKRYQYKLQADQTGDPVEKRLVALEDEITRLKRQGPDIFYSPSVLVSPSKFADFNTRYLSTQDKQLERVLTSNAWRLVFNPDTNRDKPITFEVGGAIVEGRGDNEDRWRLRNGRLELLQSDGAVHSRFVYVPSSRSFQHTCEPELPSMTAQRIELDK